MKKILFVAAIAAITFTSFKKDDADNSTDCFDCTVQSISTEYCHTDGEDFYTVKFAGQTVNQTIPEGTTWEEIKADYSEVCE